MTLAALFRRMTLLALVLAPAALAKPLPTVSAVLLSDIHFDPFHDPGKFPQLLATPADQWAAILHAPASEGAAAALNALQQSCASRTPDTDVVLLDSALHEAARREPHPAFVTVSGDLTTHQFGCRFRTLAPKATPQEMSEFASRVLAFVTQQLEQAFPGTPVYLALGNNDSGCGNYQEDLDSKYMQTASLLAERAIEHRPEHTGLRKDFAPEGDYNVPLPRPLDHARLIVLDDVFQSAHYMPCSGAETKADGAARQLAWLRRQLHEARLHHEHVWLMTHIPPGVDVYATLTTHHRDVCNGGHPTMFLSGSGLADLISEYADVVRLALFAHSHMDEMRLIRGSHGEAVPARLVPSITTSNGNKPVFLIAQVDPSTATLVDYTAVSASDAAGSAWSEEYRYSTAYHQPDFSAASAERLTHALTQNGTEAASYRQYFSAGDKGFRSMALGLVWPSYACSLTNFTADTYRECACSAPAPGSGAK